MKKFLAAIAIVLLGVVSCQQKPTEDHEFSLEKTSFTVGCIGGSLTVPVVINQKCQVTIAADASSWIHQKTKYSDDIITAQAIEFTVDENMGAERSGVITVTPVFGNPVDVTITQEAATSIQTLLSLKVNGEANVENVTLGKGETFEVQILTNLGAAEATAQITYSSSDDSVLKSKGNGVFETVAGGSAKAIVSIAAKPGEYTAATAEISVMVYKEVVAWDVTTEWVEANAGNFGFEGGAKTYSEEGFNGICIPSTSGNGTFQFYVGNRAGVLESAKTSYKLTAKGLDIVGPYVNDYALFTVGKDVTYPAGTEVEFSCVQTQSGGQNGFWTIEVLDGDTWRAPAEYPVINVADAAKELGTVAANDNYLMPTPYSFSYNIHNSTANTTWEFSMTLTKATKGIQIRQTCMAYINCNNKWRNDTNSGNSYFAVPQESGSGCLIKVL